jgi:hypothetical protein
MTKGLITAWERQRSSGKIFFAKDLHLESRSSWDVDVRHNCVAPQRSIEVRSGKHAQRPKQISCQCRGFDASLKMCSDETDIHFGNPSTPLLEDDNCRKEEDSHFSTVCSERRLLNNPIPEPVTSIRVSLTIHRS